MPEPKMLKKPEESAFLDKMMEEGQKAKVSEQAVSVSRDRLFDPEFVKQSPTVVSARMSNLSVSELTKYGRAQYKPRLVVEAVPETGPDEKKISSGVGISQTFQNGLSLNLSMAAEDSFGAARGSARSARAGAGYAIPGLSSAQAQREVSYASLLLEPAKLRADFSQNMRDSVGDAINAFYDYADTVVLRQTQQEQLAELEALGRLLRKGSIEANLNAGARNDLGRSLGSAIPKLLSDNINRLGADLGVRISGIESDIAYKPLVIDDKGALKKAVESNPSIQKLMIQREIAVKSLTAAKRTGRDVSVFGEYSKDLEQGQRDYRAGVKASVTLDSGRSHLVQSADANVRAVESQIRVQLNSIELDISQRLSKIRTLEKDIASLQRDVEQEETGYRLAVEDFKEGKVAYTDLSKLLENLYTHRRDLEYKMNLHEREVDWLRLKMGEADG